MTKFAVFANGIFWGEAEAETEEQAVQMIAEEFGTDDGDGYNTDGMTAKPMDECSPEDLEV